MPRVYVDWRKRRLVESGRVLLAVGTAPLGFAAIGDGGHVPAGLVIAGIAFYAVGAVCLILAVTLPARIEHRVKPAQAEAFAPRPARMPAARPVSYAVRTRSARAAARSEVGDDVADLFAAAADEQRR